MSFKDIFKKSFLEGFATTELNGRMILAALGIAAALALDLVLELRTAEGSELVRAVNALEGVRSVSLMSHDGEVSF